MRAVVTGAAGFIGSTLCDRLVDQGWTLTGIDSFTDYYDPELKRANAERWSASPAARLEVIDLADDELREVVSGADVVFHLAGQPGVRGSWSDGFYEHCIRNVLATQRLLDGVAAAAPQARVVFASSSSVYGDQPEGPVEESAPLHPISPYGVTKLACEHLCRAYAASSGVSSVMLRYFTVYGPRQRPDMAMHRLIDSANGGPEFPRYGDGTQRRDFTYVDDAVSATVAAASADIAPATALNVCGGVVVDLQTIISLVGDIIGRDVPLAVHPSQPGDVNQTWGDASLSHRLLGWAPQVSLTEGLTRQVARQTAVPHG